MTVDLSAAWRQEAKCAGRGADFDFTVPGETPTERFARLSAAAATCTKCPVAAQCATDIEFDLDQGVRAGMVINEGRLMSVRETVIVNRFRPDREHGTMRGYYQHRRRDDLPVCFDCLDAYKEADRIRSQRARDRRKAKRESAA